jgi:hypothetical protein
VEHLAAALESGAPAQPAGMVDRGLAAELERLHRELDELRRMQREQEAILRQILEQLRIR